MYFEDSRFKNFVVRLKQFKNGNFSLEECVYGCRNLFNAAFVSCWTELSETQQDELIESLEQALTSQDIPEITQTLLNLAEFMEHCDKVGVHG